MAALTITEIIRQTLTDLQMTDTELTDTYVAVAEIMFEKITHEDVTIALATSGDVSWDMGIAYLAIYAYYAVKKEGHMVGARDDQVPAHVWWEQTAYRHLVNIGYSEYFDYDNVRGMYTVKDKQPRVADLMAVKVMTGDDDVI